MHPRSKLGAFFFLSFNILIYELNIKKIMKVKDKNLENRIREIDKQILRRKKLNDRRLREANYRSNDFMCNK